MELDCKVVDVSLHSPPLVTPNGFKIIAGFTLLRFPLRIRGCALVRAQNGALLIWTPDPAVKFSREGANATIPVVLEAIETAKRRLVAAGSMAELPRPEPA